ncbi:MAG: hypothetical protein GY731_10840, partial [Gammaproteobacteria bacterium]|nr:hypothetical protein [Gammaproteobacteria bacterium]
ITIAIAAILVTAGLPNLSEFIRRNRIITEANSLVAYLNLARSESIKRRLPVVLCSTNDGATCGGNWDTGWLLFEDRGGTADAMDAGTDVIIKVIAATSTSINIREATAATFITYTPEGTIGNGNTRTFTVCDSDNTLDTSLQILVSSLGRPRSSTPAAACPA